MQTNAFYDRVRGELREIDSQGLMKPERVIVSCQGPELSIRKSDGRTQKVLNFCANNYLGLAGDERVSEAAIKATREAGAGFASVRFICGTHALHKELETAVADYFGYEDSILFAAAFDANGGVFEPLLGEADAIVSGEHPIIPVMLGEARLAQNLALALLERGVFVTGFFYPVVPKGHARIRTQMSAAHSPDQLAHALEAFTAVGRELGVIP